MPRYRDVRLGDLTPVVDRREDGTLYVRARQPLGPYPRCVTDRLVHWAAVDPARTLLSWRAGDRIERLTYGEALDAAHALGQALLDRRLSADRPLAILSGNDREHLLLALAAQHVGVPFAPLSPAYSLVSRDFALLRHAVEMLTPGLVYVSDGTRFDTALDAAIATRCEVVARVPGSGRRSWTSFDALRRITPTDAVARANAAITGDTIAKILFTSGSTGLPKGVINTHRMLCSNQQMIQQALPFLADAPPVLVDWLPWHHTFGGNHNIGIAMWHGGSLHIDDGRPIAGAFGPSIENLRDIAPTFYTNVPKGYEELVRALRVDDMLATRFFSRLQLLFYAAAALPQHVADELQAIAERTCGERLVFVTGLGATETAPMALCRPWGTASSTAVGLPVPGVEAKFVPTQGTLAVRVRGPNVTPGFWRDEALTRAAFDAEGFYAMGDAVRLADPRDVTQGFIFDGRLAEDFKLASGTWVHVGPLRAKIVAHFSPYLRDAVITGHDRDEVGMLGVPNVDACEALRQGGEDVTARIAELLNDFAESATGSSMFVARAMLLHEPLSLDANEVTDKGSLNQRAILHRRAMLVEELYADPPSARVIVAHARQPRLTS